MSGLILLLSTCQGLANGDRGNGRKGGKVIVILMMVACVYIVTQNYYIMALYPIPLLLSWWVPGGTGGYMPWVNRHLQWLPVLNDAYRWRFFEIAIVFTYSLLCGSIYLLIN